MTTKEAAKYLGISVYYLRNMRHGQHSYDGPVGTPVKHRCGRAYRYTQLALDNWASQHRFRRKKNVTRSVWSD